jgi:hypothetical protein
MRSGEAVELPFPVVYLWVLNGQPSLKSLGGASYYGGWACKADNMDDVSAQQGLSVPEGWKQVTIAVKSGDEFEAYTTRHVFFAPIGRRESWLLEDKRHAHYVDGGRRHLQVLGYLGERKDETFIPWGPVVLTAKGYQAKNLLGAINTWDKATGQLRRSVAPGVSAWCFYMAVGTFEKERVGTNVGKPGAQSPITPLYVHVPQGLNEARLEKLYVGNEVAAVMADLRDQAEDWLQAWSAKAEQQPDEFAEPEPWESGPSDDEILF